MRTIHEAFQFLCQTFADDVVKNTMANKKLGAMDTGPYRVSGMYTYAIAIDVCKIIPLIFSALIDIGSKLDNDINLNEANETLASTVNILDTQQICKLQNDEGR